MSTFCPLFSSDAAAVSKAETRSPGSFFPGKCDERCPRRNSPRSSDEVAVSQRAQQILHFARAKVGIQQVQGRHIAQTRIGLR